MVASLCYFSASCNFYVENATDTPWMWEFIAQNKCVSQHAFHFASASLPHGEVSGKDISVVHFCSLGPFVLLLSQSVTYPQIFCIISERRTSVSWKETLEGQNEGSCFMATSLESYYDFYDCISSYSLEIQAQNVSVCVRNGGGSTQCTFKMSSVKLQEFVLRVEKYIRL